MLRVGLVGVGFMGWIHYLAYRRSNQAKLVAFASRDADKRRGDWRGIQGNFGPPGEQIDASELAVFESLEQMLSEADIDVVDICLPPQLHLPAALAALRAGKHVWCEKPLGLTTQECDEILSVAREAGKMVLVAQVLPFMGPFQYAYEHVLAGTYGKPLGGYFKRIISEPTWIEDFYEPGLVGGAMIDLHVHDLHFIRMLFGMPQSVTARGQMQGETARMAQTLFTFEDPSVFVGSTGGVIPQPGRPFCHGLELYLEEATLQFELAACSDQVDTMPLKIFHKDGGVIRPQLPDQEDVDAFRAEIDLMAQSISSGEVAPPLSGQIARDAIHLAHCVQQSIRTGEPVSTG